MFKLNMTEFEIRRKIGEDTKDNKVHRRQKISIKNHLKDKDNKPDLNKDNKSSKKYFTIEAKKIEKIVIEAQRDEDINKEIESGIYIDKRE